MTATVHALPATDTMTADMALDSAKALNLESAIVIGIDPHGRLCVRSSRMNRELALWLVKTAELHVMQPLIADYAHANLE